MRRRATSRAAAAVSALLLLLAERVACAEPLELYRPPGMAMREVEAALEDDLGSGIAGALPLALLAALTELEPEVYGETVAELYERYGFLSWSARPERPVGIVAVEVAGLRAQQFNCLACHAGVDPDPGLAGGPRLVIGAPNTRLDFTGWYAEVFAGLRRIVEVARAEVGGGMLGETRTLRRAAERLLEAARAGLARRGERLRAAEGLTLVAMTRSMVQSVFEAEEPLSDEYGPGRTLVQGAYRVLRFDLERGPFAPIKAPDLFGVSARETLLWTGIEAHPKGRSAAERIARNGMLVPWIQVHPLTRAPVPDALTLLRKGRYEAMGRLLAKAAPPPAPGFSSAEERAAFARGRGVFEASCARCHGRYEHRELRDAEGRTLALVSKVARYEERLVPAREVGTDPRYSDANDLRFQRAFEASLLGRAGLFRAQVTDSYVARPLLGLRMRAPYLHNGSIPTLEALLQPESERPTRFPVGRQARYDPARVGLSAEAPADAPRRETSRPGDEATGHPYGWELDPDEREDLLIYLRRL